MHMVPAEDAQHWLDMLSFETKQAKMRHMREQLYEVFLCLIYLSSLSLSLSVPLAAAGGAKYNPLIIESVLLLYEALNTGVRT